MNVRPIEDRLLVKPDYDKRAVGKILIPDTVAKNEDVPKTGTVVATGPGAWVNGHHKPMQVSVGDRIIYKGRAHILAVMVGDQKCVLLKESEVFCLIPEGEVG